MSGQDNVAGLLQEAHSAVNKAVAAAPKAAAQASSTEWWSTRNAMTMCAVLLLFSILVLGLSAYLIKSGKSGAMILRVFGTILVITMATFLVIAGYDERQLGAPLGLLGTIVGYLLGRESSSRTPTGGVDAE